MNENEKAGIEHMEKVERAMLTGDWKEVEEAEMTRAEHLEWAKRRALEELENPLGGTMSAVLSMLSDLGKHPELESSARIGVMIAMTVRDRESCRRFITEFN